MIDFKFHNKIIIFMKKTDLVGNGTERMDTGDSRLPGVSEVITRTSVQRRTGSVNKSLRRMLRMMAVVLTALMTITACVTEDEDVIGDDDDGGNGGGGGGVAGKRIKTMLETDASGVTTRSEYIYNSNGSLKQSDTYDKTSTRIRYSTYTYNSNGTLQKWEAFAEYGDEFVVYTHDANKKPLKGEGEIHNSLGVHPVSYNYTFQNGRQIRQVMKAGHPGEYIEVIFDHNYDNNGRRISTTETHSVVGTRKSTRTYNSDGTLQKIVVSDYAGYPNTGSTSTFTWENGKSTLNDDDYAAY
jgi:hypothetical protein